MATTSTKIFENGTILGAISENVKEYPTPAFVIPEIVISASQSSNSLNRSRCDVQFVQCNKHNNNDGGSGGSDGSDGSHSNIDDSAAESTALLECQQQPQQQEQKQQQQQQQQHDEEVEFEQFIMNRTGSDSNILESSIYSELHFPHSLSSLSSTCGGIAQVGGGICVAAPQAVVAPINPMSVVDMLNVSACSRSESQQGKRMRRKAHRTKSKCNSSNALAGAGVSTNTTVTSAMAPVGVAGSVCPPQYATIFLDAHHHHGISASATAASTAPAAPTFINANLVGTETSNCLQYHQLYQQHPIIGNMGIGHFHHTRSSLMEMGLAVPSGTERSLVLGNNRGSRGSNGVSQTFTCNFGKWLVRPSLPFVIGIFALGGVACTLGGIVLGSTGLVEHSTQYLSAALLMIGIGVSLLVIAGAIWRLSLPDDADDCNCLRRMEPCRTCNSIHCNNVMTGGYLHPEFQNRPPPPSYLTSLNEYAFCYHPGPQPTAYATVSLNAPPPLYRSAYSLNNSHAIGAATAAAALPSDDHATLSEYYCPEHSGVIFTRDAVKQPDIAVNSDEVTENSSHIGVEPENKEVE